MGYSPQSRILLVRAEGTWGQKADESLRSALRSDQASALTATTGEEAVSLAAVEPVDLVIADLVLPTPGISGAYTLVRIRELCPDCKTVIVSDHDYLASLLDRVADVFLLRSKNPRSPALGLQLVSIVRELLAGHRPVGTYSAGAGPMAVAVDSQLSTLADELPTRQPDRQLIAGKYRLGRKLGEGGMGQVYRAEDVFIQRQVALKVMRVESSEERAGRLRQRMHREVMIAGRLMHPNVVTVHDAGFHGENLYLVMALIDGPTLREYLALEGPLEVPEALKITLQILEALTHAHSKGIIHRDLKPSNVLMTLDGLTKVADFGLAKIRAIAAESEEGPPSDLLLDLTDTGIVLGTFGYMAPEQMLGWPADSRADLFSVGALLFEMLHGHPLSQALSPVKLSIALQLRQELPDLPAFDASPEIDQILRRALSPQPRERFQTSEELAERLRSLEH